MLKKSIYLAVISIGLLLGGCTSAPKVKTKWVDKSRYYYSKKNNPIEFRYQPVIGTKQADTKVMIDMGQWAKIWVKNYRNENKTFIATHSIITMIREPGFITGEQIPRSRRDTVSNTYGARSFSFKSQDLTYDNSSYGSEYVSDKQIKDYMNSYEYSKKTQRMEPQRRKEVLKIDKAIIEYIKNERKKKEVRKKKLFETEGNNVLNTESNEKSDAVYDNADEYKNGSLK